MYLLHISHNYRNFAAKMQLYNKKNNQGLPLLKSISHMVRGSNNAPRNKPKKHVI